MVVFDRLGREGLGCVRGGVLVSSPGLIFAKGVGVCCEQHEVLGPAIL